ncbi:MAG: Ig-like domain-containing protein, partial [Myxococcota bacterium]
MDTELTSQGLLATLALVAGISSACLDVPSLGDTFACATRADCVDGYDCVANVCQRHQDAPQDTVPPIVENTVPSHGALAVPTSTTVVVTFSEAMDVTTLDLDVSPSVSWSALWSAESDVLTITFESALANDTGYVITIDVAPTDLAGNQLTAAWTMPF